MFDIFDVSLQMTPNECFIWALATFELFSPYVNIVFICLVNLQPHLLIRSLWALLTNISPYLVSQMQSVVVYLQVRLIECFMRALATF